MTVKSANNTLFTALICPRCSGRTGLLTVHGSVVAVGVHPLVGQDLDVFAAGAAVQLVGAGQPAAHPVRQAALLGDVVLEVRRRLRAVLSGTMGNTCRSG